MLAESTPYLKPCPRCGVEIPTSCRICWQCGEYLDPKLREIAKHAKETKP
jgi:predicted amidophosphoribosyltransferase